MTALNVGSLLPTITLATNLPHPVLREVTHEYGLGNPAGVVEEIAGLLQIDPRNVGHIPINDNYPQYWFVWGNHIVIEPEPDTIGAVKLYYSRIPEIQLVSASDFPSDFPSEFRECVLDFSLYALSLKLKKWKSAASYYNRYVSNLSKRKKEYIDRKTERREIHRIPDNVKSTLRKEVDSRVSHRIPANVTYQGGTPWAH